MENKSPPMVNFSSYLQPPPLLLVVSGPSGVGKDSVIQRMKDLEFPLHFVVTATTRPPRPDEVHGVNYYFIDQQKYDELLRSDGFLEHAQVYGYQYGIPKAHVREALDSGQDAIMRVDVQGAATVHRLIPDAIMIFLLPGSEDELVERLRRRKTESPQALQRRIDTIHSELQCIPDFDYVVVNSDGKLDQAVEAIAAIIRAEKCRVQPRRVSL
jgi:guanylate kinase